MSYKEKEQVDIKAEFDCIVEDTHWMNGSSVRQGDKVLTLNCMKMMQEVTAPCAGKLEYQITRGDYVYEGQTLAVVSPVDTSEQ